MNPIDITDSGEDSGLCDGDEPDGGREGGPADIWQQITIGPEEAGKRVDVLLTERLQDVSRSRINTAIRRGLVEVSGRKARPSDRCAAGTEVRFQIPDAPPAGPVPENIPLDVLHEDDSIAVINKPAGMVVHPAKGHWSGTLAAALAWRFQQLSGLGGARRPGIVHRLDRDTSGVIVVARTDEAHAALTHQFQNRTVQKEYLALVSPPPGRDRDRIELPIGVHPWQREKMAVRDDHPTSRPAASRYEVRRRSGRFAEVAVFPETGRTHQIRVHLAAIGSPVLSDKLYSGRGWLAKSEFTGNRADTERVLERQALHALRLTLRHPATGETMTFSAPVPADMAAVIALMG